MKEELEEVGLKEIERHGKWVVIKVVKFSKPVPRCATEKQYRLWREEARRLKPAPDAKFCEDCTPSYQREMLIKGRCENPEIRFFVDIEGWVYGSFAPANRTDPKTKIKIPDREVF